MVDASTKRRKIEDSLKPESQLKKQASFSAVLEQLEAEEDSSTGQLHSLVRI